MRTLRSSRNYRLDGPARAVGADIALPNLLVALRSAA